MRDSPSDILPNAGHDVRTDTCGCARTVNQRRDASRRSPRKKRPRPAAPSFLAITEFNRATAGLERIGNDWSPASLRRRLLLPPAIDGRVPQTSSSCNPLTATRSRTTVHARRGQTDKHLIYEGLSQVAADAVLSGANTIGGDIVSRSGILSWSVCSALASRGTDPDYRDASRPRLRSTPPFNVPTYRCSC
jgi:hypothetical protein